MRTFLRVKLKIYAIGSLLWLLAIAAKAQTPLSGTYRIGTVGADYASFTAVLNALKAHKPDKIFIHSANPSNNLNYTKTFDL